MPDWIFYINTIIFVGGFILTIKMVKSNTKEDGEWKFLP